MVKSEIISGASGWRHFSIIAKCLIFLVLMSTAFGLLLSGCSSREIEVGEIKYKKMVGIKSGDEHTVLIHKSGEPAVVDIAYADYLPNDTLGITISDEFSNRLLSDFEDIRYFVGLELCKNEDLKEFKLVRDHFNKLRLLPGLIVKVEYETQGNRVISLIDY